MKILISLTYYTPNKSGLTVYAERVAAALVKLGHSVTVLTSKHLPNLPPEEMIEGVKVIRLPVFCRLSKGLIMPSIIWRALKQVKEADVINLHTPQFEGAYLAIVARLLRKPLVATHHSDLTMPSGWLNQLAGRAASLSNHLIAKCANWLVHNTQDFAENSPFLRKFIQKLQVIPPPIVVKSVTEEEIQAFISKHNIKDDQVIIGMAARLAAEKGVEYLVEALGKVRKTIPSVRVLFAGEYQHVIGEESYKEKIMPMIEKLGESWTFLGVDSQAERAAFYHVCRVLVLPSVNNTETFGMVQVEALKCGTPVIASDLPGVRQPVLRSGLGEIVPPKNSQALAQAILRVLDRYPHKVDAKNFADQFSPETIAKNYEALFERLV